MVLEGVGQLKAELGFSSGVKLGGADPNIRTEDACSGGTTGHVSQQLLGWSLPRALRFHLYISGKHHRTFSNYRWEPWPFAYTEGKHFFVLKQLCYYKLSNNGEGEAERC